MDYNLWQKLIDSSYGKRATLPIRYFTDREDTQEFMQDDLTRFSEMLLGATKPFRTGANILAQNYGSALTGKDMSQSENQGGFLKWLAGGITPQEQETITQKPYLSALKSSAGMASTLAPFAANNLRSAQFAIDPLKNRLAQLASQGALEGSLGGFGFSREGSEVQDTLLGAGLGVGGEIGMDYLTNPSFRGMLNDQVKSQLPQYRNLPSNPAFKEGQMSAENLLMDRQDPNVREFNMNKSSDRSYLERIFGAEGVDEIVEKGTYKGRDATDRLRDLNIRIIREGEDMLDTINPTGTLFTEYSPEKRVKMKLADNITTLDKTMGKNPDDIVTIYRGAPKSQKKINPGDFITTNYDLAKSYAGDGHVLKDTVRLGDILDDRLEPLGEEYLFRPNTSGNSLRSGLDTLQQEAKNYATPEEFVRAQGIPVYHGGSGVKELSKEFRIATPEEKLKFASSGGGYEGLSFSTDKNIAKQYSRNIGDTDEVFEGFINPNAKVKKIDLKGETPDDLDLEALRRQGYDAIQDIGNKAEKEFRALTERAIITKSQLMDIWKRAQGK